MLQKSKSGSNGKKQHFNKEIIITKNDEYFENYTKFWICGNICVNSDVKVRNQCYMTEKYGDSARRNCNTNAILNYQIALMFQNLKNCNSHLIMQEPSKFNFKMKIIPKVLEEVCMSFSVNDNSTFINSFAFLYYSLENSVKNFGRDDFKYLNQGIINSKTFDSKALDLLS